ncbi:MAG: hypothetical protein HOG19_03450 [Gammaproteobacteria bacterium]|nr:hypothetical protein [Gammaproteobacteria bacterium]
MAFSDGGSGEADFDGTYLTAGGAGLDGAISTELTREEGGQIGIFSAKWVTSNLSTTLGTGATNGPGGLSGRGGTTGDQFQESSLWTLDGNDLEKDVYKGMVIEACEDALEADTAGTQFGFAMRVKKAIADYNGGTDADGNSIPDYFDKAFDITDYFGSIADHPLSVINAASSVMGLTTLLDDLKQACSDILRGQESFTISQYVLRNTKTTQYTSSIAAHLANTNRIWTTANIKTLMAAETRTIDPPVSTDAYDIPLLGVLGSSGIFDTSKWLYRTPDIQELNNGKWQITKEFWEGTEISLSTYKVFGVA